MKILFLADEESKVYWEYFKKEDFEGIDVIVSCGDLKASYLSFLTTMVGVPVLYVHGNHDDKYSMDPPEGCTCIEDKVYEYEGVRFVGLGGSNRYKPGKNQYTERQMTHRAKRLKWKIWRKKGFDILVTHSPARGLNDGEDMCHKGFEIFNKLIKEYKNIDTLYKKLENGTADDIKGALKEKLEKNKELAIMSRTLGTILRDAPLDVEIEDLKTKEWNKEAVTNKFKELKFNRFIERFDLNGIGTSKIEKKVDDLFGIEEINDERLNIELKNVKQNKKFIYYIQKERNPDENAIVKEKFKSLSFFIKF